MKINALFAGIVIFVISLFCAVPVPAQQDTESQEQTASEDASPAMQKDQADEPAEEIDGQSLFKQKCNACHHPTQRLVGPALQGVRDRRDSSWLINFVQSSQSMVESGDSTAQALFMEFNQVPMPDHNQLSTAEINAILDYVHAPEEEQAGAKQPISRPEMPAQVQYQPLEFSSFAFWLIYTAMVFMIIGWLYYMIEYTEIVKKATGNKKGRQEIPFGEQDG